jgi:hypothetical protein
MTTTKLRTAALFGIVAASAAVGPPQTTAADRNHTNVILAQPTPSSEPAEKAGGHKGEQSGQGGMMSPDMMGQGMMGQGRMGARQTRGMRGHMMKFMFAIADTNGDRALSFEEVTAIHKRIFDRIDSNKDGNVTIEEVQAFTSE